MTREEIFNYCDTVWRGRPFDIEIMEDLCDQQETATRHEVTEKACGWLSDFLKCDYTGMPSSVREKYINLLRKALEI